MPDGTHLSAAAVATYFLPTPSLSSAQQSVEQRGEALFIRYCAKRHGIGRTTSSTATCAPALWALSATCNLAAFEEVLAIGSLFGQPIMPKLALVPGYGSAAVKYLQSVQDR